MAFPVGSFRLPLSAQRQKGQNNEEAVAQSDVACTAGCVISPLAKQNTSAAFENRRAIRAHPNARVSLVIDEELGFVVTSGVIPGKVYPYQNISAFIPDKMTSAQEAQVEYLEAMKAQGTEPLLSPIEATYNTLEVLQYYNDKLQAMQINVYLSGPNMTSPWL